MILTAIHWMAMSSTSGRALQTVGDQRLELRCSVTAGRAAMMKAPGFLAGRPVARRNQRGRRSSLPGASSVQTRTRMAVPLGVAPAEVAFGTRGQKYVFNAEISSM